MIRSAFRFLSAEVRGLNAAVFVLAFSALLSSLLALGRDRLLAHIFGAGATLDLYYAAFRLPDLMFVGIGALVSVYILIPELARRNVQEQHRYLDTILAGFLVFTVLVACAVAAVAPAILSFLYPQFAQSGTLEQLVLLTRVMLLQPILLGISNIFAAVTQSRNRYTLYSISPLLYNVGIIIGVTVFYQLWGIVGLAWGVVLGAALHMLIQVPSLVQDGFATRMPWIHDPRELISTAFISLPRALTLSMNEIAKLGLFVFAGFLAPGSIAIFSFAYNLQAVPLAIIGASYSVAAFPTLAAALSRGERQEFIRRVSIATRYVLFWSIPAIALIVVLRAHLVRVVLGSGEFDWTDTRLTAAVFALLVLSLAAQGISLLLIRAYYAAGRTFVPFVISCGSTLLTFVFSLVFLNIFADARILEIAQNVMRLKGIVGSEILSLALAYALSSIVGTVALVYHFDRRFGNFLAQISSAWWQAVVAALSALLASYAVLAIAGPLDVGSTTLSVFLKGFAGGATGLIVAGIAYWIQGSSELDETVLSIYGRYFKKEIAPPQGVAVATTAEDQPGQS